MIYLLRIQPRGGRLDERERELVAAVNAWQDADLSLLPQERHYALDAIQSAIAGLEAACEALAVAVKWLWR
jgi:hypothetical protein